MRTGAHALRKSLLEILDKRQDEISPRMHDLIIGLYEDWLWLDERVETLTGEIEAISTCEANCQRLMSVPGIGPIISTAMVAAIGGGEAFGRGRDFGAWLGLVPRQYSTGVVERFWVASQNAGAETSPYALHPGRKCDFDATRSNWEKFSFGAWLDGCRHNGLPIATSSPSRWPTSLARIAWSVLRHEHRVR